MLFDEIRHQQRAIAILRRALAGARVHHAYLFEGPEGVGKESTARLLAAGLLCLDPDRRPDDDACGRCDSCRLLRTDNHPDYRVIHRGLHKLHPDPTIRRSSGLFLVIDVVRHFVIEPASNRPMVAPRRVFILRDAERMNEAAQNALLKTLEEPPGSACLVLISASGERLLPTIRSRCQRIPFDLLPKAFIVDALEREAGIAASASETLAALSQGRLGAALQWHRIGLLRTLAQVGHMLAQEQVCSPESFGKSLLEIAEELAIRTIEQTEHFAEENQDAGANRDENGDRNNAASKASASKIETDELRAALKLVFMLIAAICRDALVARVLAGRLSAGETREGAARILPLEIAAVDALARRWDAEQLGSDVRAAAGAERMLDRNVAPQLVCEHLAIELSGESTFSNI